MLQKKFWQEIFKKQAEFDSARRQIIGRGSDAQHLAKQAIFAVQRGNLTEAKKQLAESEEILIGLNNKFGREIRVRMEATWKAAIEEFVEAKLFFNFVSKGKIGSAAEFNIEADEYIGALSDVSGEIVRSMIIWSTKNEMAKVKKAGQAVEEIIHELLQHTFGGYLRTKFDQAKRNLQKSEEILYDLKLKKR